MISVTPQAANQLRSLIKHSHGQPSQALKLVWNGKHGINMGMGTAQPGDVIIQDDGVPVLIIAGGLARRLDGLVFDWLVTEVDGNRNAGFTFRQPVGEELGALGADIQAV